MEDFQLTPAQRKIFPYVLSLAGGALAFIGLLTPWLTIGANGLSGSKSDQGNFTYLIIAFSLTLGLSFLITQLKPYKKFLAIITGVISLEILISYVIWGVQVLSAIRNFNKATDNLGSLGGLFGGALSNLAKSLKPSITTGFYMVCAGALLAIIASMIIFKETSASEKLETTEVQDSGVNDTGTFIDKNTYFGLSKSQFIFAAVLSIAGLVLVVISALSNRIPESLNSASSNTSSSSNSLTTSVDAFKCLKVDNVRNLIKLNQPSFSGDPEPTDIFAVTQFKITNNCGKQIIGIKGSVTFQDVVGDTVFTGSYTDDQTIDVGASLITSADTGWTFNEFEDQYHQLAGLDQTKTHAVMALTKVAFGDGTSINE